MKKESLENALSLFGISSDFMVDVSKVDRKTVRLSKMESGTILHALIDYANKCGGVDKQPQWFLDLYERISILNEKL